ncbi:tyrosine-protein phosphatase [Latilactobacillus fuchuensis]|uniref:tyrosine-protein phosphatase n=1 Tax=Latilactobacillus fuchuensis TaxID=164393 RepID=UPI0020C7F0C9|nr:tyrosine-protein phosphatase [Latilactobacillus fuchuensis]MCP8856700.1 tyrosine-protein phosphatase [Latilactobacillus fuchuensis]
MQNRILPLQQGRNFRELGGYQTTDGHTLKWHKLIRSATLANLNQSDLDYLADYGLQYDVDFRSVDEKTAAPDRLPQQTTYELLPVFAVDETANSASEEEMYQLFSQDATTGYQRMVKVYDNLINQERSKAAYRRFFELLLANDQDNSSLLFHCSAGKDRTGMGAAFLLSALGVPETTIQADYLLTNQASANYIQEYLNDLKQKTSDPAIIQSVHALLTVDLDYLNTAKKAIQAQTGSVQNYLKTDLKLTDHDLADLRQIYLN